MYTTKWLLSCIIMPGCLNFAENEIFLKTCHPYIRLYFYTWFHHGNWILHISYRYDTRLQMLLVVSFKNIIFSGQVLF